MNKLIPILIGVLIITVVIFLRPKPISKNSTSSPSPAIVVSQEGNSPTTGLINTQEVIAVFLQHIAQKRVTEAVLMMSKNAVPDDTAKQAWEMQYNAFKKLIVQSIEPSMEESWKDAQKTYRVVMDVEMDEDSAEGVIPYFGYVNGINMRWITIEKEGADWKIAGISTGP